MSDHWDRVLLGQLIEGIGSGNSFKCDERVPGAGEIGVAKVSAVTWGRYQESESKTCADRQRVDSRLFVRKGDFLLSRANTIELVGACVIAEVVTRPIMLSDKILRISFTGTDARWILHFLRSRDGRSQIEALSTGNQLSMRNIAQASLRSIQVPLPPLNEQRRIVAKLEDLLARSGRAKEALDAIPPLLEKLRQSILAAALRGDLTADWRAKNPDVEPVAHLVGRTARPDGKSTGRDASVQVREGRHALAVGEPSRDAPPGWSWVPLLRIAKLESGHTPSRKHPEYWDGGIPWIGIKDAREHHAAAIHTTFQTVSEAGLANSAARLLPTRTVCLSRTASVGYVTIMGRSMATSQDFANWICSEALLPEFLMYALLAEGEGLRDFGEGTTHTTIYYPELKALHITLPPISEQQEIVTTLQARLGELARLKEAATSARSVHEAMAPAILAKAFRGALVPQDPNDEPASVMLERLAAERTAEEKPKRGRGPTKRARA